MHAADTKDYMACDITSVYSVYQRAWSKTEECRSHSYIAYSLDCVVHDKGSPTTLQVMCSYSEWYVAFSKGRVMPTKQ